MSNFISRIDVFLEALGRVSSEESFKDLPLEKIVEESVSRVNNLEILVIKEFDKLGLDPIGPFGTVTGRNGQYNVSHTKTRNYNG